METLALVLELEALLLQLVEQVAGDQEVELPSLPVETVKETEAALSGVTEEPVWELEDLELLSVAEMDMAGEVERPSLLAETALETAEVPSLETLVLASALEETRLQLAMDQATGGLEVAPLWPPAETDPATEEAQSTETPVQALELEDLLRLLRRSPRFRNQSSLSNPFLPLALPPASHDEHSNIYRQAMVILVVSILNSRGSN